MNKINISKLSCQQIFDIWRTEPDIINIIDLRSFDSYKESHIPGAIHLSIENFLESLHLFSHEKLNILICPQFEEKILNLIENHPFLNYDFTFMNQCHEWIEKQMPMTGTHQNNVRNFNNFKDSQKKDTMINQDIIFYQLFEQESSTYTYIVADKKTKEAAIIDSVVETFERDKKLIEQLELKLLYVLDTHVHADHITAADQHRKYFGAKTCVSNGAGIQCVDINLEDGQELLLGNKTIKAIATPGHTDSCMSYYFEEMIFTGDTLLINGCGRTDFQQGSSEKLFHSVREKIFNLPNETLLYPAHDYKGFTSSTIGHEKKFNQRLNLKNTFEDFKKIMDELKLSYPKKIDQALPANKQCGRIHSTTYNPKMKGNIPEVSCEEVADQYQKKNSNLLYIDVRRADEYNAELGHLEGSLLVTLGEDLTNFLKATDKNKEIVFICRSGKRSGDATLESIQLGFKNSVNMTGGMLRWNELKLPTKIDSL